MKIRFRLLVAFILAMLVMNIGSYVGYNDGKDVPIGADGGYQYDDLSTNDNIGTMNGLIIKNDTLTVEPAYSDNFESYTNGQSILGKNGWVMDLEFNAGTAIATTGVSNSPSTTVAVFENPDASNYENVLSGVFDLAKGGISFWYRSSYVYSDSHSSSGMHLANSISNPYDKATERAISIGCQYGGWTSYNGDHITHCSLTEKTWYKITIMWDCNTDKYSTFVYDSDGALLGSGTNIDFRNPSTSIRRFTAGCGKRAFTTPFSMWLDDLEVYDFSPATNRYAVTRTISLPPGKEWSVLSIDKEEKGLSIISTSILDINNDPIHGISYNPHESAIDLTTLNELGVTSIKLKFNFTLVDFEIPVLKGYGIEWSDSNAFYDTFLEPVRELQF